MKNNKKTKKEKVLTYKDVLKEMIKDKQNQRTFDYWIVSKRFTALGDIKAGTYKNYEFVVIHTSGGGIGMDEYPPKKTVLLLHKFQ